MFTSLDSLFDRIKNNPDPPVLAVVCAENDVVARAVSMAKLEGVVSPLLFGDPDAMRRTLDSIGENADNYNMIACSSPLDAAGKAISAVKVGQAHLLLKGDIHTSDLMRAVLNRSTGIRASKCLFNLAILEIPRYHKLMAISDGAVLLQPSLEQKAEMILRSAEAMVNMGYEEVRTALLAASEEVSEKQPETLEAAELKRQYLSGQFPSYIKLDGPMAFDLAVDEKAVKAKHFESEVAGNADLVIAHNIVVANAVTKALRIFAGAESAGIVLGASVPIVVTSRGASARSKHLSILFAAAAAGKESVKE